MLIEISDKSKKAFEDACIKLGISSELPDYKGIREDLALYMTAQLMLAVIIEADKGGKLYDITNHDHRKYENIHYAKNGYEPGSGGGGFSFGDFDNGVDYSLVGARLSFNSHAEGRENAENYPDLWEIIMLNVR
jgi:hypothetical protein